MSKPYRIVGLSKGGVDTASHEILFELTVAEVGPVGFSVEYGPASQVIGALGRMLSELRRVLDAAKGTIKSVAAEKIVSSHIQKDQWENVVIMQLTNPLGVPYTFAIPPKDAAEIADQLKTESAKPHKTGSA